MSIDTGPLHANRDLDFGGIDAESDHGLTDYFVSTPYVRYALEGRRTQLLGRKGSGKSALFRQIPTLSSRGSSSVQTLLLTPNDYAWSALKEYNEQGLLPEHAHANAWKFTLVIEASALLVKLNQQWSTEARQAIVILKGFVSDNFGELRQGTLESARKVVKGITSFDISAFGFGLGLSRDTTPTSSMTPAILDYLIDLLKGPLSEQRIIIALDRLDDSWDGSSASRSLLVGLLKAAKELNDRLGSDRPNEGLRIDVFLRSDIYDDLSFDDKDKHRQLEERIVWSPELLREMVNRRLPRGITVDDVFEPGDMRGSIKPFNYLVKRTFLRPREVIQFLDECKEVADPDASFITKNDIRIAEDRYSRWKVEDLSQEYNSVFPEISQLLECLRQQVHRYDSIEEFETLVSERIPGLASKYGTRFLVEKMFEFSIIGVRVASQGAARFKAEDADLVLPQRGSIYVHQSLFRGLFITETRKTDSGLDQ